MGLVEPPKATQGRVSWATQGRVSWATQGRVSWATQGRVSWAAAKEQSQVFFTPKYIKELIFSSKLGHQTATIKATY